MDICQEPPADVDEFRTGADVDLAAVPRCVILRVQGKLKQVLHFELRMWTTNILSECMLVHEPSHLGCSRAPFSSLRPRARLSQAAVIVDITRRTEHCLDAPIRHLIS